MNIFQLAKQELRVAVLNAEQFTWITLVSTEEHVKSVHIDEKTCYLDNLPFYIQLKYSQL